MSGWRSWDRVSVFDRGRVCAADGYGTVLSVYSPSSCCVIHEKREALCPSRASRMDRPSEARVCGNPACERWFESPNPKRLSCSDRCRLQAFYVRRRPAEDAVAQ
jgi:hypothetical protein